MINLSKLIEKITIAALTLIKRRGMHMIRFCHILWFYLDNKQRTINKQFHYSQRRFCLLSVFICINLE